MAATVCSRAFSSPEATLYEIGIAPAVAAVVTPIIVDIAVRGRMLDVGCGGGRVAAAIASATGSTVVGVDLSTAQTRRMGRRAKHEPSLRACLADAERLPFRDGYFDTVFSSCAVKHWPSPRRGLLEGARVARSGGRLVIVEIDGASTPAEVRAFARLTRVPIGMREGYVRFAMRTIVGVAPDAAVLGGLLADLGLVTSSVTKVKGLPYLVGHGEVG